MINLGLLFRRRKLLPLSVSQLRWRWRRETSPRRSERASDERERTCHFELRAEGRVSAASEIQRRQYFILKGRRKRRAKGREGGFWGISPQIPKTQRQNGRRQNRGWEQSEKIGPLSLSLSLSAVHSSVFVRATTNNRETGTIITGRRRRRKRRRNRSVSAVGKGPRVREQGSRGGREGGRRNPPLLAPQHRLFGNFFLSQPHYSILNGQGSKKVP